MCGLDAKAPRNSFGDWTGTSAASVDISLVFTALAPSGKLCLDVDVVVAICPKNKHQGNQNGTLNVGMDS